MNETPLLDHLLRAGLTPNFSFPLDVCEFTASGVEDGFPRRFVSAQQDLRKGLGGYAPGKMLVIDDIEYMVGGLAFFNPPDKHNQARHMLGPDAREESLRWFSRCVQPRCGWVYGNLHEPFTGEICPVCGQNEFLVSRWFRPDGFAPIIIPYDPRTDEPKPEERRGWTRKMRQAPPQDLEDQAPSSRPELPAPLHPEDEHERLHPIPFDTEFTSERFSLWASNASLTEQGLEMIIVNGGYRNRGMWICEDCGRIELRNVRPFGMEGEGHFRPYAPPRLTADGQRTQRCNGNVIGFEHEEQKLMLGMTFRTDLILLRIEFPDTFATPSILARSMELDSGLRALKEAILEELNAVMEFENREVEAGLRRFIGKSGKLVVDLYLFDQQSGGAGLTSQVATQANKVLPDILKRTEERLRGDHCVSEGGCESACLGCLVDYRNQFDIGAMNRKHGLRLLRWMMYGTMPSPELGGRNQDTHSELEDLASRFQEFDGRRVTSDAGWLKLPLAGGDTVRLRPVSELVTPSEDPVLKKLRSPYVRMDPDERFPLEPEQEYYLSLESIESSMLGIEARCRMEQDDDGF